MVRQFYLRDDAKNAERDLGGEKVRVIFSELNDHGGSSLGDHQPHPHDVLVNCGALTEERAAVGASSEETSKSDALPVRIIREG